MCRKNHNIADQLAFFLQIQKQVQVNLKRKIFCMPMFETSDFHILLYLLVIFIHVVFVSTGEKIKYIHLKYVNIHVMYF
jgi:hypothetical protein